MSFLAPLMWLATLLRWSFAQANSGFAHILAATMSIPSYFFALWVEELDSLAYCLDKVLTLIAWSDATLANLHATTEGKLADACDYFTATLPEDFHDTFGNLLGDVSWKEWTDLFSGILFIAIITAMWYLCMHLSEALATHSPSPLAPEDSPAEAREFPPTPSRPTPVPLEPMVFEHFPGDVEYFKKAAVYYPPTYNLPSRLSFLHHPPSIPTRSYPPEPEPPILSPTKEHGGAPRLRVPSHSQQTPVQNSRTPHQISEFAPPQADIPPAPSSDTPLDRILKALDGIPDTPQPLLHSQPVIPPLTFEMVCSGMKEHTHDLRNHFQIFYDNVENATNMEASLAGLKNFLELAFKSMSACRSQLTTTEAWETGWTSEVGPFWNNVYSHGYFLCTLHGDKMHVFLQGFAKFGRFLQLDLPDLDMTPPYIPPPPPTILPALPEKQNPPLQSTQPSKNIAHNTSFATFSTLNPAMSTPVASQSPQLNFSGPAPPPQPAKNPFDFDPHGPISKASTPRWAGKGSNNVERPQLSQPVETENKLPVLARTNWHNFSMAADRLHEWDLTDDQLLALTKENLGWTDDAHLWAYDPATDLALKIDLPAHRKAAYICTQLDRVALKFKRAAVILRLQAHANSPNKYMVNTPKLAGAMKDMLEKANKMFKESGKPLVHTKKWYTALHFFRNNIMAEELVHEALETHYGEALWDAFDSAEELASGYFIPPPKTEGVKVEVQKEDEKEDKKDDVKEDDMEKAMQAAIDATW